MTFWCWLLSLRITPSRAVQVVARISSRLLCISELCSVARIWLNLPIYFLNDMLVVSRFWLFPIRLLLNSCIGFCKDTVFISSGQIFPFTSRAISIGSRARNSQTRESEKVATRCLRHFLNAPCDIVLCGRESRRVNKSVDVGVALPGFILWLYNFRAWSLSH